MKHILFYLSIILLFSSCVSKEEKLEKQRVIETQIKQKQEDEKKQKFEQSLNEILFLIKSSNINYLNSKYINQNFGIYKVFIDDVSEKLNYTFSRNIEIIDNFIEDITFLYEDITFNCSSQNDSLYGWSKDGVFVSSVFKNISNKLQIDNNIKEILNGSKRVIITNNIVFYLSYIDNSWYITLIDEASFDCIYEDIQ
jgi:hypothetical protein